MRCVLCGCTALACQCADSELDLPRAKAPQAPAAELPTIRDIIRTGTAFDPPPLQPGQLRLETELLVMGEPVACLYFAVPEAAWLALEAEKKQEITDRLGTSAMVTLIGTKTRVRQYQPDPAQPELFAING